MANELQRLQQWYRAQCNGDWEHSYGVKVDTLDNPGWRLRIDLEETDLATAAFSPLSVERSDTDWVHCKVEQSAFHGHGGAENLTELLDIFLRWAEKKGVG